MKKIFACGALSFIALAFIGTVSYANHVYAAPDCTKEYCALTTIPGVTEEKKVVDPVKVITNIYGISIGIGAILAVVMIIWAGIEYSTTEAITGKSDAKEKWQGALFGLLLLLASYIILRTINVDLVNIKLDLGKSIGCQNGVTVGVDGKPLVNSLGKTIPCVSAQANVFEKLMNDLTADIGKTTAILETARKDVATTEALLVAARAKNSPDQSEIASLEKTLKQQKIDEAVKTLVQRATSLTQIIISNSLSQDNLAEARKRFEEGNAEMKQDFQKLVDSGASNEIINKAGTSMNVAKQMTKNVLEAAEYISNKEPYIPFRPNKDGAYVLSFNVDMISKRSAFMSTIENIALAGGRNDSDNLAVYKKQADTAKGLYDKALANKLKCKGNIKLTTNSIYCQ